MRNLPPEVRSKAIEIANALLDEGYNDVKAIRIVIAKAKNGPGAATHTVPADHRRAVAYLPVHAARLKEPPGPVTDR